MVSWTVNFQTPQAQGVDPQYRGRAHTLCVASCGLGGRVGEEAGLSPLSIFKNKTCSFLLNKKNLGYVPLEGRGRNHRGDAVRFYWGTGIGLSVPFARELAISACWRH